MVLKFTLCHYPCEQRGQLKAATGLSTRVRRRTPDLNALLESETSWREQEAHMPKCEGCGNEYDKSFRIGPEHAFHTTTYFEGSDDATSP